MEIKPVHDIKQPKYPLKAEFNEEELKKRIPKRWTQSPAVKIALGTLAVVSLSGCYATGGTPSVTPPTEIETSTSYVPEGTAAPAMVNVAPLFEHGEGRGMSEGDAASITAFVSEDEALAMINEAALGYGLEFSSKDGAEFYNVLQPVTDLNPPSAGSESTVPADTFITFSAGFSDSEHGIAIEFITKDDVIAWSRETSTSAAQVYDTKDAAAQLSEALKYAHLKYAYIYEDYAIAVLYDPCDFAGSEAEARELSKEDIKAQAKDFFEWLKSRGII